MSTQLTNTQGNKPICVTSLRILSILLWFPLALFSLATVFFLFMAILSWDNVLILAGLVLVASFSLSMVWMSILGLLSSGTVEIDSEAVVRTTPVGCYRLKWNTVDLIEIDPLFGGMVLYGSNIRVAIPGPSMWSRVNRNKMYQLILAQIEQRQIETERTVKASFKLSRSQPPETARRDVK